MSSAPFLNTLHTLLRLPREQGTVEFKSNLDEPSGIGRSLSALANTAALGRHDRAWVVWSVDDATRRVHGTCFDPFTCKARGNQSLMMWLQQITQPRADFEFYELQHAQGRVVLLEIQPSCSAPVASQQQRWICVDSHAVKLADHPDKEARLWVQLGQKDDW